MTATTFTSGDVVYQDDQIEVTSSPVEHPPIEPAVGFRVDYRGRSVVISGDTNATESLVTAAKNTDLVLHDAPSRHMLDTMIEAATEDDVPVLPTITNDVIDDRADSLTLEEAAANAGVRQLALYHLVPAPPAEIGERLFARGLSIDTILVRDLQTFDLPPNSTETRVSEPWTRFWLPSRSSMATSCPSGARSSCFAFEVRGYLIENRLESSFSGAEPGPLDGIVRPCPSLEGLRGPGLPG